MKKLGMLGILVLGAVSTQTPASGQVIGFKVGATFSNLSVDNTPDATEQNTLTQFGGGGFIRFGFGSLVLQPELLVITKGSEVDVAAGTDDDLELKLDYLEIPVLLRFGLGSSSSFSPYALVGPTFSFEIDCTARADADDTDDFEADCDDDADIFERSSFDFGVTGALGFEVRAGPGNILFEGRYTHGFTNISDTGDNAEVKNRSFALFAGYAIALGSPR